MEFNYLQQKAKNMGFEAIELHQTLKTGIELTVNNGKVERSNSYETNVYAIRGLFKGKSGVYYTEILDKNNIEEILSTIISNTKIITSTEPSFYYAGDKDYKEVRKIEADFNEFSLQNKIDKCLELEKIVYETNKHIFSVKVSYNEVLETNIIQNSNGLNLSQTINYAYLAGQVSAKKDEEVKNSYNYQMVKNFSEFNLDKLRKDIVRDALKAFGAEAVKSKQYKTILRNDVATMLLSAFSSIFSAEALITKTTFLEDQINEQVFGRNITIVDEPLCKRAFIKYPFDDEGVKAEETILVQNGYFKTFLHNLKTAKMFKTKSTSNGFKGSIKSNVTVAPSNLYIKQGPYTPAEINDKCKSGIMITSLAGLHSGVNVITGDFNLQAEGYKIENGKISKAVNLIVLSGNIKDVLNNVLMIGDDLHFEANNVTSPTLLVKSMAISGKN